MLSDDLGQVTLIDMGLASSGAKVMAALRAIGSGPGDATRLMLTPLPPPHAGGAAHVSRGRGVPVDLQAADAEYVRSGTQPAVEQTSRIGKLFRKLPAEDREGHRGRGADRRAGGAARGWHPGGAHAGTLARPASYLHEDSGVLITGAIFGVLGMRWPMQMLCSSFAMTKRTAHRLAELEYAAAAFTHGPEIQENPRDATRRPLSKAGG